jgi:hypothetical protein
MADVLLASMQKSGVKTLSIIDTISELATDKTEASRLTLPSPISVRVVKQLPGVPPRNPKVSVPLRTPPQIVEQPKFHQFNGAKPRFFASSPSSKKQQQQQHQQNSPPKLNLSAINQPSTPRGITGQNNSSGYLNGNSSSQNHVFSAAVAAVESSSSRGQTPDWIRDIFQHAKRGNREKLVRFFCTTFVHTVGGVFFCLMQNWTIWSKTIIENVGKCWENMEKWAKISKWNTEEKNVAFSGLHLNEIMK